MAKLFTIFVILLASFATTAQTINDSLLDAAEKGDMDLLLSCLKDSADVNYKTPYDSVTALMYASQNGHLEVVKVLIYNGAEVNAKPWNGSTALHAAVTAGEFDVADYLIRNNANVDVKDNDSITPLILAAGYNDWLMCDMLIFYGADVNAKSKEGTDALQTAAYYNNTEICKLLASKGAEINSKDNQGYTPIYCAAQNGNLETFKYLLDTGANIKLVNNYENSPIDAAIFNDQLNILLYFYDTLKIDKEKFKISSLSQKKALVNNSDRMRIFMQKNGLKYKWPFFEKVGITYNNHWNFHDIMMGGNISIHDVNYNTSFHIGVDGRIAKKRVLVDYNEFYFQYWEQRTSLYSELRKNWGLYNTYRNQLGVFTGLKGTYSMGKYLGTNVKPDNLALVSPHIGVYWDAYYGGMHIGYEYIDYKTEKISPHKINVGFTLFIHYKRNYYRNNKSISWL